MNDLKMNTTKQGRSIKRFKQRILMALLVSAFSLISLAACSPRSTEEDDRPVVYTSFYTLYDFATKIAGEHLAIDYIIPAEGGAHGWEPSPSDITVLEEADAFIYNGAGLEHWVDDVLAALENDTLLLLNTSEKVHLIDGHSHSDDNHDHEDDDHDDDEHEAAHDDDHDHSHDDDEDNDHDHSHEVDPHVWLSPLNAKMQMEAIKDLFIEIDPEHRADYESNYATQAEALDALDLEFQEGLADLSSRDLVVSHEAFGYLADRYDLHQEGVEGLTPHSEPDAARMAEIIDYIKSEDIQVVFFEELEGTQVAETIAAETSVKTASLSPIEKFTQEQIDAGEDYFSKMRENLATLIEHLS